MRKQRHLEQIKTEGTFGAALSYTYKTGGIKNEEPDGVF